MFHCGQYIFAANFECANLASVAEVPVTDGCQPNSLCSSCHLRNTRPETRTSFNTSFSHHSPSSSSPSSQLQSSRGCLTRGSSPTPRSLRKGLKQLTSQDSCPVGNKNLSSKAQSVAVVGRGHGNAAIPPLQIHQNGKPDHEFQLYTAPDCANTAYENTNRTWFFFSISGGVAGARARLRIMNMNKQVKLYSQGMKPVKMQVKPGVPVHALHQWTLCSSSVHCWSADGNAILSWIHTTPADTELVTYYAFTFPYSYTQLQQRLEAIDEVFSRVRHPSDIESKKVNFAQEELFIQGTVQNDNPDEVLVSSDLKSKDSTPNPGSKTALLSSPSTNTQVIIKVDSVYYVRELVVKSLDSKRLDLITVSSYSGITNAREDRLPHLFPDGSQSRPFKFKNKKYIFISARVHPGETPSSFVFNGFLDFILSDDARASKLRDLYVFKLVPMLNPDGVVRGHYRTDQYGVNLNRVYCNPSVKLHPTIEAARSLLLYYHSGSCHSCPSVVSQPPVMDEDTCHSFSDANAQHESKSNIIRANVSMDLDEPSASGWDISSNQSVDSTLQSSSMFFRGLDLPDLHDDCSNISGLSEAETGVTSMFGALAASASDPDSYSSFAKRDSEFDRPTRIARPAHFVGPTTRSRSTAHSLPPLTEHNLKLHSSTCSPEEKLRNLSSSPQHQSHIPVVDSSQESSSPHPPFVPANLPHTLPAGSFSTPISKPDFSSNSSNASLSATDFTPPSRPACLNESKIGFRFSPSSNFFRVPATDAAAVISPAAVPSPAAVNSSSESEAEVGEPGREGASLQPPSLDRRAACAPRSYAVDSTKSSESGLHMYVDMHGHASKRGIFLYGNWFPDVRAMVDNLLLAKLLAINCGNFDFNACNFTEKNMSVKDRRNGLSKEGSGRVAVMRLTGLLRSYTLECNYNTGRCYAPPPPLNNSTSTASSASTSSSSSASSSAVSRDKKSPKHGLVAQSHVSTPPKYTPAIFEECGRELAVSILDSAATTPSASCFKGFDAPLASIKTSSPAKQVLTASPQVGGQTSNNSSDKITNCSNETTSTIEFTPMDNSRPSKIKTPSVISSNEFSSVVNPLSRLPASQYGSLDGVKMWLRNFLTSPSSSMHTTAVASVVQSPLSSRKALCRVAKSPGRSTNITPQSSAPRSRPLKGRAASKVGDGLSPSSSPKLSPKVLRSKSQNRMRHLSWTAVDAENREPVAGCSSVRSAPKYGLVSSPKIKTHKLKAVSPKKVVSKALMFTDIDEACSSSKSGKKQLPVRAKHSLTSSVCLTPNLDVHLSITDVPGSPKLIKKVEKIRRERSRVVGGSFKKLKTGCGQSLLSSPENKEVEELCHHEEVNSPNVSPCLSPRSPLSCVFQGSTGDDSRAGTTAKTLKLPSKIRTKVTRSLSQGIAAKSLDVLPSAISVASCSKAGSSNNTGGTGGQTKGSLGFCTQSSPDLNSGIKLVRKKLRLKSGGNSGSENDVSAYHETEAASEVTSLPWLGIARSDPLPTPMPALVPTSSETPPPSSPSDTAAVTVSLTSAAPRVTQNKKKRKAPIRKSL
ncbi:pneumococcal serine-rich repeat protein-like [Hyalella azteca]|uniref:Pneumococcal serine-rich repeat protein-like n=1 Tax=Hyalella azteca TaxID=294128 RepID=A0A8B7P2U8_HYAAZ|nr:pneumococcal serine-rich repeat protein-like [Hyalella azteca]